MLKISDNLGKTGAQLLIKYPSLSRADLARNRFKGYLEELYIFALLATRNPEGDATEKFWIEQLRVLVLIQAMERAAAGNIQDKGMREVATSLRIVIDGDREWLKLFLLLRSDATDLDVFEHRLIQRSEQLRLSRDVHLKPSQNNFLRTLIRVTQHEHMADARPGVAPTFAQYSSSGEEHYSEPGSYTFNHILGDEEDEYGGSAKLVISGGQAFAEIAVDPNDSYQHQKLKANSVILNSVEENLFLPWSWSRLNPVESETFIEWVKKAMATEILELRMIGSLAWVAYATGRSLRRALDMAVSDSAREEWSLSKDASRLIRLCPRREEGWTSSADANRWVRTLAERQELSLPEACRHTFCEQLVRRLGALNLGELWQFTSGTPAAAFLKAVEEALPRVTPSMLAQLLPQRLYQKTGDSIQARLFCRHPQTGLPGSAAYASWTEEGVGQYVNAVLGKDRLLVSPEKCDSNAMGSRLDVIDDLIRKEIRHATYRLIRLRRGDLIQFHNAYTAYLSVALHASTGARPVQAAFESWRHFDFQTQAVFVDDKSSGGSRNGRMVPLPPGVGPYLETHYRRHLNTLAHWVGQTKHPLAKVIADLARINRADSPIPPFFFLSVEDESLEWSPVTEAGIDQLGLFNWPLPLRHFRHRLANRLREAGLEPEIIDGVLGHAERGNASYSDYSVRVWDQDSMAARIAINRAFIPLGFMPIEPHEVGQLPRSLQNITPPADGKIARRLFGRKARSRQRRARMRMAIDQTNTIIRNFLGARELTSITQEEIDKLAQLTLFNDKGLPHSMGTVRYGHLLRRLERHERKTGRSIRISRRYALLQDEPSLFSSVAPGATHTRDTLLKQLHSNPSHPVVPGRGYRRSAIMGVLHVMLESRVSDKQLIRDLLQAKGYRLVRFQGRYYMEHGIDPDDPDPAGALVRRFAISYHAAHYLAHALAATNQFDARSSTLPPLLLSMSGTLDEHLGIQTPANSCLNFFERLARVTDQVNALTYPGVVAGYLAGRVESYSLGWRDWTRMIEGWPRDYGETQQESNLPDGWYDEPADSASVCDVPKGNNRQASREAAKEMLGRLRKVINRKDLKPEDEKSPDQRKQLNSRVKDLVNQNMGMVSPSVIYLGQWAGYLLTRPYKSSFLNLSTIERYISEFTYAFVSLTDQTDLADLEEEAITELYFQIIESSPPASRYYRHARLRDFHCWLASNLDLEEPDWAEIPGYRGGGTVAAGIYSEHEHLRALAIHLSIPDKPEFRQCLGLLQIMMFRFGLRRSDALGIRRRDWVRLGRWNVIVVQKNKFRDLKTAASRRVVPQTGQLSEMEDRLIDTWLAHLEASHGDDREVLVFGSLIERTTEKYRLLRRMTEVLRSVTGNPRLTPHHGRHSAATWTGLDLFGLSNIAWASHSTTRGVDTQALLLGRPATSRRALPALARHIGHAGPTTTCRSYFHCLGDWADSLNPHIQGATAKRVSVTDLDVYPLYCPVPHSGSQPESSEHFPSPVDVLHYLRLLARGHTGPHAADLLGMPPKYQMLIDAAFDAVAARLRLNIAKRAQIPRGLSDREPTGLWLSRITTDAWKRILQQAEQCVDKSLPPAYPSQSTATGFWQMFGATGQLLIWEDEQTPWLRAILDWWDIKDGYVEVHASQNCDLNLLEVCSEYRIQPRSYPKPTARTHPVRIDVVHFGRRDQHTTASRCAVRLHENSNYWLRNNIEFVMVVTALGVVCLASPVKSNPESQLAGSS